jgi:methylation protein EvaC
MMSGGRAQPYQAIAACRGCDHVAGTWDVVFEMEPMPLAGYFPGSIDEALQAPRFPLTWVRCEVCGLVQVLEDVDDALLYEQYRYGSSTVAGLVRHFESYARFLADRYGEGQRTVLEIGCNDGVLLDRLPTAWERIGVDPSDIAGSRTGQTYRLINEPFDRQVVDDLDESGSVDVVTSSNAMAHFSRLREAIEAAHTVLKPGGEFFLEIHDLDATLATGQWDTVYHEHKVEWSERSLAVCMGLAGFEMVYLERLPVHGGLMRAGFRKIANRSIEVAPSARESFEGLRARYRDRMDSEPAIALRSLRDRGARLAAYGAAGRANVWLNQMADLPFDWIVDDSAHRSGRWIPSVGTPIVPASRLDLEQPDACLITAWNYAADIRAKHPGFKGRWLQTFVEDLNVAS